MAAIIAIFLLLTLEWLIYWVIVRPMILDSVQDEIRRMKFDLQWAYIQNAPGAGSEPAQILLNNMKMASMARFVSFGQAIFIYRLRRSEIRALYAKERATFQNAQPWIREMWQRHRMVSVKSALANSPFWWPPLAVLLLASVFSRQAEEWWDETETAATKKLMTDCPA